MKKYWPPIGICLVFVFLFTGCTQYTLVKRGSPTEIGKTFRVDPQIDWSMFSGKTVTFWTVDGPLLDKLVFLPGVENGKPLVNSENNKQMPLFSSTMSPIEVMDLVEATLARQKAQVFKKENLMPAPFGKLDGFRFTFSFLSEDGLQYKGFAAGIIKNQKLYMIMYTGTNLLYYDKYVEQVEKIVNSIEII